MMNAKLLLMNNELTVKQIAEELTFNDPTNFSKFFKKHTELTPMYYRHSCMER
ncbi:MAG: helix-turn-helix domain-containing protein [Parabacteroides sp.]